MNGEEINDTHLLDEKREVNVSCLFTRGSPPVNVCLVSDSGQEQSICREEGPIALSLGVYKCDDMWPTVRCEAPGSELNRSVAILFKCEFFNDFKCTDEENDQLYAVTMMFGLMRCCDSNQL